MEDDKSKRFKFIMDREKMGIYSAEGCASCHRPFAMGEMAVMACGNWGKELKPVHENEAVYDPETGIYYERACYQARGRS
jgi:hypothetical protein